MKKKAIEKIPYIRIREASGNKKAKYIGATAVKIIGGERHLFLEVHRNKKEDLAVPLVRIVITKKDFGTFFVNEGKWTRGLIARTYYTRRPPIWDKEGRVYKTEEENVLRSEKDLQRIHSFLEIKDQNTRTTWIDLINDRIDAIATKERIKRTKRIYERRQQGLKEREENTPEIDEKKILDYADRVIFREKHYLYYRKYGAWVRVACSKCGGVTELRWKPGISYESQLAPMIEEPRQGYWGTCPMCRAHGRWIPQGRANGRYSIEGHLFVGQKYKETGMVLRYFEVGKEYELGLIYEDNREVMENARERISGVEIARVYFEEGKEPQKDYHKHSMCSGEDFWDDCNLYGMGKIPIDKAPILSETWEAMQGTICQYSAMKEFAEAGERYINPVDYLERYIQLPQIEMLTKLGLIKVVEKLVEYRYSIPANENANRVDTFLKIRKDHVNLLIRHQGEESILKILQTEKRLEQHWTDEQVEKLAELSLRDRTGWMVVLEHMGVQKMLNLIEKYAGTEYGTGCSWATSRLQAVAQTYFDYINMRQELGYDMSNSVYLAPRDLNTEHQKMVMEQNQVEADQRIREVDEKYPLIKKHYRRLRRKFYYEDEDFCIRPAKSAGEIVLEGRILHHCVGGDNYLKKHNDDISTILFLRPKTAPDVPYITVEVGTNDLKLIQWYGEHDRKPDKENMDRWLNIYMTKLRCSLIGAQEEAGEEAGQQVLAMLA